ncbi:MAG: hypothetical protein GXP43_01485 [bacterium]|nr:hypothetical protein [bacterium]
MIKKGLFKAITLVFSLLVLSWFLFAPATVSAQSGLLFGQNHFYTVVFRGNGEAVVYVKMVITNPNDRLMTNFSFTVPKVSPSEMAIYQMKLPPRCIRYDYKSKFRVCLEYKEPDYLGSYYPGGPIQPSYKKIEYEKSGNLYRFDLPTPVRPYKTTALIIAYTAKGYVTKNLGLYKFNFETLKVPFRINQVNVAVDVDSDLYLKGKRASVNYQQESPELSTASIKKSISSPEMDKLVNTIGYSGALFKRAKNLAPNESLSVKGTYAASKIRLYLSSIMWALAVVAAIFLALYLLTKILKNRNAKPKKENKDNIKYQAPAASQPLASAPEQAFNLTTISMSFVSSLLVVGLTYLLNYLNKTSWLMYLPMDSAFGILVIIFIALLYILIIFGPPVFLISKYGWKAAVLALVMELIWLGTFLIIYVFITFSRPKDYPYYPHYRYPNRPQPIQIK